MLVVVVVIFVAFAFHFYFVGFVLHCALFAARLMCNRVRKRERERERETDFLFLVLFLVVVGQGWGPARGPNMRDQLCSFFELHFFFKVFSHFFVCFCRHSHFYFEPFSRIGFGFSEFWIFGFLSYCCLICIGQVHLRARV